VVRAESLSAWLGAEIWLKIEGANPTGSFKDRGMTCAVSAAVRDGTQALICASTGNTSASAAAYGARAGLATTVVVPEGKIAPGKLAQALMYGAQVLSIDGNFDAALTIVRRLADEQPISLVNSVNEFRIQGQKTAAFELMDVLGEVDGLAIPVGNGGNISAYGLGFRERQAEVKFLASKLKVQHHWWSGMRSSSQKQWRQRSGSAIQLVASELWMKSPARAGLSVRSAIRRSSQRSGLSPAQKGSFANRHQRHQWLD
jgi:threonine synthase